MIFPRAEIHQPLPVQFECGHVIANRLHRFRRCRLYCSPQLFQNTLNVLGERFDVFVYCFEFLSGHHFSFTGGHFDLSIYSLNVGLAVVTYGLRGIPHTIKVERKGNELIVHIACTESPSWDRTGVILASEGWQDIGYGLKMQLTIASTNIILQNERIKLIQKPGILDRLRGKKIPMLEDKS